MRQTGRVIIDFLQVEHGRAELIGLGGGLMAHDDLTDRGYNVTRDEATGVLTATDPRTHHVVATVTPVVDPTVTITVTTD
ncbi:hypothetical protein [Wenjunlia tyrosinilytica]|uniref:Uncharacterized protein n=1 Tax=Wenjunlia tyrosinilytica TaxID=1544741 RepID=A0A917ZWM3_9ACTN|nr:hypothetical protein [Wenjunlia tyrosinilytica]GGO98144.1 hypothetical protein GCM10012280_61590 [Wenjunlia tyrosinilytica]